MGESRGMGSSAAFSAAAAAITVSIGACTAASSSDDLATDDVGHDLRAVRPSRSAWRQARLFRSTPSRLQRAAGARHVRRRRRAQLLPTPRAHRRIERDDVGEHGSGRYGVARARGRIGAHGDGAVQPSALVLALELIARLGEPPLGACRRRSRHDSPSTRSC